jgi:hypothetical protein
MITANQGIDYEFKTPQLQASDVQHDGKALLNQISAGEGLPSWMITSDATDSNFASTLVSEAPGIKELQDWQDFFEDTFKEIYDRVMQNAIDNGAVPTMEEVEVIDEETKEKTTELQEISKEVYIVFPELVHRKILEETKALTMQRNEGAVSLRTYSGKLDLDYDEEQEMIKQEKEEMESMDIDTEEVEDKLDDMDAEESFRKARKNMIDIAHEVMGKYKGKDCLGCGEKI